MSPIAFKLTGVRSFCHFYSILDGKSSLLPAAHYDCIKRVSEYDQEISQIADKPMAPRGRATQLSNHETPGS